MDSRELSEWLAFFQLNPMPDPYLSSGIIAHAIDSAFWSGKGPRPKLQDRIPRGRFEDETIDAGDAAERLIKQLGAIPKG